VVEPGKPENLVQRMDENLFHGLRVMAGPARIRPGGIPRAPSRSIRPKRDSPADA
jgi:hypothetical protein